ncbi:MAG: LysM peptidoglycan-binding domain-containing protein [Candidatus Promineifilaceae bacterium]|nr:LysM peptidoglycan-binding domain-containing protein [Candidatus Promineifilaceae bacterium]
MSMVFVLVVSAVLCAAATFLALTLVNRRSASAPPAESPFPDQVVVDDMLITLDFDPNKVVFIPPEVGEPAAQEVVPPTPALGQEGGSPLVDSQVAPEPTLPLPTQPPPTPVPEPVIFIDYVVQGSDSLYSIAESQNSSIELMALHGIDDENLQPGATLRLPVANPAYCSGLRPYVVRDKDTAFRIAQQFSTTAEEIARLNNLDASYTIFVTQVLCVPG